MLLVEDLEGGEQGTVERVGAKNGIHLEQELEEVLDHRPVVLGEGVAMRESEKGGPLRHGGKVGEAVGEEVGARNGGNDDAVDERDDRNNDFFWNLGNGEKTERKRI